MTAKRDETPLEVASDWTRPGVAVLTATGEIDVTTAPTLTEALQAALESSQRDVVVDLSHVSFVDSIGLGVLVRYYKLLLGSGGRMRVVVSDPAVRRIFDITGLGELFGLAETLDAALADDRATGRREP